MESQTEDERVVSIPKSTSMIFRGNFSEPVLPSLHKPPFLGN